MFKISNILNPQTLFETTSLISGNIKVTQRGNERRLMVGGYVQSINWDCPGVEKRVWGKMAAASLAECPNAKKILLLGLGAGTVVGILREIKPELYITAIEIDEKIIRIADEYFGISTQKGFLDILNRDALELPLMKDLGCPDIILIDVYCGGNFPEKFWGKDFMETLAKIMNKGGCVIFNRILRTDVEYEVEEAKQYLLNFFKTISVQGVNIVGNSGNILFICKN